MFGIKCTSSGLVCRWFTRSNKHNKPVRHYRINRGNKGSSHGYFTISINRKPVLAHRLICEAFHGPSEGRHVNHKNGCRTDNRPSNLEWVSQADNNRHATYILKSRRREPQFDHAQALALVRAGISVAYVARKFGVSYAGIKRIMKKELPCVQF